MRRHFFLSMAALFNTEKESLKVTWLQQFLLLILDVNLVAKI